MTTTASKPKLAYLVTCEDISEIVYATSSVVARRQGAHELGLEFQDVESCCRAPYLDAYATTGEEPTKLLIEEYGWRYECGNCFKHVDQYTEERVYDEYESPYCCAACLAAERERIAKDKADKEAFTAIVNQRCPGAEVCWISPDKGTAFLRIPDAKAGATWVSSTNQFCCQPNDKEAWQAYKSTLNAS